MFVDSLFLIFLITALKTYVKAGAETDKMVGEAVDSAVDKFMKVEEMNAKSTNVIGYWPSFDLVITH